VGAALIYEDTRTDRYDNGNTRYLLLCEHALRGNQFYPSIRLTMTCYNRMIVRRMSMKFGLVAVVEICRSSMRYGY